ncbi:uncharacterized protein LOC129811494 isoform X2 [Salvelinus fontinalis]|uniref:uncharacterized protein LOC129811494 isoform X2 n=1 Tax=Salvelinus fontinalis TaxID=8038 RepID=UPI0024856994|nr:uncharacterized protein LOC129811494 isoform X2 [Salvelinus fontinalis]
MMSEVKPVFEENTALGFLYRLMNGAFQDSKDSVLSKANDCKDNFSITPPHHAKDKPPLPTLRKVSVILEDCRKLLGDRFRQCEREENGFEASIPLEQWCSSGPGLGDRWNNCKQVLQWRS